MGSVVLTGNYSITTIRECGDWNELKSSCFVEDPQLLLLLCLCHENKTLMNSLLDGKIDINPFLYTNKHTQIPEVIHLAIGKNSDIIWNFVSQSAHLRTINHASLRAYIKSEDRTLDVEVKMWLHKILDLIHKRNINNREVSCEQE